MDGIEDSESQSSEKLSDELSILPSCIHELLGRFLVEWINDSFVGVISLIDSNFESEHLSKEFSFGIEQLKLDLVILFVVLGLRARDGFVFYLESERDLVVCHRLNLLERLLDLFKELFLRVVEDTNEIAVWLVCVVSVVSHSNLELNS